MKIKQKDVELSRRNSVKGTEPFLSFWWMDVLRGHGLFTTDESGCSSPGPQVPSVRMIDVMFNSGLLIYCFTRMLWFPLLLGLYPPQRRSDPPTNLELLISFSSTLLKTEGEDIGRLLWKGIIKSRAWELLI